MVDIAVSTRRALRSLLLAVLGSLVLLTTGQAQNRVGIPSLGDPGQANPILQMQKKSAEALLGSGVVALEGALDADAYTVGPGDQFSVSVGGTIGLAQRVPVSADGELVLPEAGLIDAAGHSLADVQQRATKALKEQYRNVPVEVSLVQPRMFYVHVAGAIPEPGRYLMLPVARVDDAVQQAYATQFIDKPDPNRQGAPIVLSSATSERPALSERYQPSLRDVTLIRRDSTRRSLDLIRYYTTGETEHNPYLLDGDVIQVPSYHVQRDAIRVTGEVPYPGTYAHRPGDTVLDVLRIATGGDLRGITEVRLTRRAAGAAEPLVVDVEALQREDAEPVAVQPGDNFNVPIQERAMASIYGLVEYPGTYPVESGATTLRELIALAGGLKDDANPRAAFIERRKSQSFKQGGEVSDLDFFSRAYLQRSLNKNRLVVDLQDALEPEAADVVIFDQDRVVFPRDEGTIFVTGNVPEAGYVDYADGQSAGYYVDQAGGAGPLSTEVYVFTPDGQMRTGRGSAVRPGDTIFIDREDIAESPEIASLLISDESSRRQARIMTTQTVISSITAAVSLIATLDRFGVFGD
jgi:protein involved in polysaccharide export with SLBB domain